MLILVFILVRISFLMELRVVLERVVPVIARIIESMYRSAWFLKNHGVNKSNLK